ncbi:hypothetical protein [Lactiplantibacillus fabifermentans]|uniref:Uncharacterized protein n=2 Tax=Lactiplantibacillus fabifermentans TaxID=483011 RepID=A0A0R2NT62_9LACO|nr:hypothetical protein [Lactiplantibacillus fabifermentans]ETY75581.1 hypothetical protein LFAB_01050 [Lactiplantibacillus fabifermentans T30PCM01]KRO28862.1 hypothetical protein DY78_GL001894 [Lactiplantibacillus fabifermentans DSM 21115]
MKNPYSATNYFIWIGTITFILGHEMAFFKTHTPWLSNLGLLILFIVAVVNISLLIRQKLHQSN